MFILNIIYIYILIYIYTVYNIYIYTVYNIYIQYIYIYIFFLIYSSWSYAQPVTSAVLNWGSQVTSVSPQSWIIGSSLGILFWSLLCRLWRKPNFGKAKSCAMAFKNRLSCFLFLRQNLSKPTTVPPKSGTSGCSPLCLLCFILENSRLPISAILSRGVTKLPWRWTWHQSPANSWQVVASVWQGYISCVYEETHNIIYIYIYYILYIIYYIYIIYILCIIYIILLYMIYYISYIMYISNIIYYVLYIYYYIWYIIYHILYISNIIYYVVYIIYNIIFILYEYYILCIIYYVLDIIY